MFAQITCGFFIAFIVCGACSTALMLIDKRRYLKVYDTLMEIAIVMFLVFAMLNTEFLFEYVEWPYTYIQNYHVAEEYEHLREIYGEDHIVVEKDSLGIYTVYVLKEDVNVKLNEIQIVMNAISKHALSAHLEK